MDRFEWLKCQSWLVPCSTSAAAAVDWCFEGFASFYTSSHGEENEALSENTAHLFFSVQAPSLDPAQFVSLCFILMEIIPLLCCPEINKI